MERPFVSNVEDFVSEFIRSVGGEVLTEKFGNSLPFPNADYIFEKENVVLELKCLEKDIFSEDDYSRNEVLLNKWIKEEKIRQADLIPIMLQRKILPAECLIEVLRLAEQTYLNAIETGNRQLRETKNHLCNPSTQKVLLICNDGNYFLSDEQAFRLISHILATREKLDIDCFVLFTVNQTSRVPDSDLDFAFWAPDYSPTAGPNLQDFINRLCRALPEFYNRKFGVEVSEFREFSDPEQGLEALKRQKHIPKEIIYGKKDQTP